MNDCESYELRLDLEPGTYGEIWIERYDLAPGRPFWDVVEAWIAFARQKDRRIGGIMTASESACQRLDTIFGEMCHWLDYKYYVNVELVARVLSDGHTLASDLHLIQPRIDGPKGPMQFSIDDEAVSASEFCARIGEVLDSHKEIT